MNNFKIIKKGYSQLEVDSYIEKLKEDYEARLAEQKDRIFYLKDQLDKITNSSDNELVTSLVGAVERARMIETSSKNIYELETKKLNLLYTKMENLLTDENIRNDRSVKKELLELIQDCRSSLESNIMAQSENVKETTSGDPVKTLLSKMIDFNKETVNYNLIKREAKIIEENNKKTIKIIPTNEVIRKEVPSSVKVVQVRRQQSTEKQAQNVLVNTETVNEFNKFLSENNSINGANFESIMFSKSQSSSSSKLKPSSLNRYSSRRERIQQSKQKSQDKALSSSKQIVEDKRELSSTNKTKGSVSKVASSQNAEDIQMYSRVSKSATSSLPKYSYSSKEGLQYSGYTSSNSKNSIENNSSKIEKSNSRLQSSTKQEDLNVKSSSAKSVKEMKNDSIKLSTQNLESSKSSQKSSLNAKKVETISNNDEMEISSKSKNSVSSKTGGKSSISVETNSKTENTTNGKVETKNISVSGVSGNTNFSATASYKSSYSSSSSSSNPNDELSDEEFLRAYLGDLEYEEQERQKNVSLSSTSSYSKSTHTSITTTSSTSSSKKSNSNAYITGGRMGDYSPNETGFDLKEAVNPKEDLDEIMKAFDFFNDNKKKK